MRCKGIRRIVVEGFGMSRTSLLIVRTDEVSPVRILFRIKTWSHQILHHVTIC
jgi:hypothetical protein